VPLHFDHTPERLETTGRSVVLEVVGFGTAVVALGACVILISSRRYDTLAAASAAVGSGPDAGFPVDDFAQPRDPARFR